MKRPDHTMTCQCCGRRIKARTGNIAHHGYERPGDGWQTASCMGARALPFEVSRDRLGDLLAALHDQHERAAKHRAAVAAETVPTIFTIRDRTRRDRMGRPESLPLEVTRANFDSLQAAYAQEFRTYGAFDFDTIKERALQNIDRKVTRISDALREAQSRFDGWRQTHQWDPVKHAFVER
ncbi:hypothetical protein ACJMQP_04240 [Rhodopseudomonas palustris]